MAKIVEIKPEDEEESLEEDETVEEEKEEAPIDFSDRVLVGEEIIVDDVNPTLDRRIVNSGNLSPRRNLEDSLEDVSTEKVDEDKKPETYSVEKKDFYDQDNSKYIGGNTFQSNESFKRVEEVQGFDRQQRIKPSQEFSTPEMMRTYDMKSIHEAEVSAKEQVHTKKYETMR